MGSVYRGMNLNLEKPVAIKIVSANLVADQNVRARFDAEVRALAQLHHPNLINIIDVGVRADGCPFYVMDYIEGLALDTVIKQEGALSRKRAVPIFKQIASALSYAHSLGIVHRDIKPSNIMLAEHDFVMVIDLGIAKIVLQDNSAVNKLTTTGEVFGSPVYMSPEQGSGKPIDARTDIYSLGCVMFEALTGRAPIIGQTPIETIFRHMTEIPPAVSTLSPDANMSGASLADEIVARCLEKNPDARYQSALELIKDLEYLEVETAGLQSGRRALPKQASTVVVASKAKANNQPANDQPHLSQVNLAVDPKPKPGLADVFRNKMFWAAAVPTLCFLTYLAGEHTQQHNTVYDGATTGSGSHNVIYNNEHGAIYNNLSNGAFVSPVENLFSFHYHSDPAKTPIYVAATYTTAQTKGNNNLFGDVDVDVDVENKPVILALSSYKSVTWHIKPANDRVRIEKVVAFGYYPMKLAGVPVGASVVKVWYKNFDAAGQRTRTIAAENQAERIPQDLMKYWGYGLSILMNPEKASGFEENAKPLEAYTGGSLAESESCYLGSAFKFPIKP